MFTNAHLRVTGSFYFLNFVMANLYQTYTIFVSDHLKYMTICFGQINCFQALKAKFFSTWDPRGGMSKEDEFFVSLSDFWQIRKS